MPIDWPIAGEIAKAIVVSAVSIGLSRILERRSKLVAYFGHVSEFTLVANQPRVHTHAVVVRNTGKKPAHNVRMAHQVLPPNVSVLPLVQYTTIALPGGGAELLFPILVPGEQITVSYLYFAPLTFNQINRGVKSDEGFAKPIDVLPTPQLPKWQQRLLQVLLIVGIGTICFVLFTALQWVIARL